MSTLRAMDPSDIPDALRALGKTQADLARFMDMDPSSLTKTIKGARRLQLDESHMIDEFFEMRGQVEDIGPRRTRGQRRIPIYGYAMAGETDTVVFDAGRIIEWIEPPFAHSGADMVAIRVLGDSMEPRLFAGELVIAQLGVGPARDRDCLVELLNGGALVKTFRGQRSGHVFLEQYNPGKQISIEATKVRAIHAIKCRL